MEKVEVLVIDAGPIISSSLHLFQSRCTSFITTEEVLAEIKDPVARSNLSTLYNLEARSPAVSSVKFIKSFAGKTGDREVLSSNDIGILALTYELECEKNGGDWRLRRNPGQEKINGPIPEKKIKTGIAGEDGEDVEQSTEPILRLESQSVSIDATNTTSVYLTPESLISQQMAHMHLPMPDVATRAASDNAIVRPETTSEEPGISVADTNGQNNVEDDGDQEDDGEGWITPSNISRQKNNLVSFPPSSNTEQKTLKVACATTDFAMQNVLLQVGLNLLSTSGHRITRVKTWVLRCHACFKITREMGRKFCPSCGGPTLLRTSCSTDANGKFQIYLKQNMQWNNRGTIYSIPKTKHGSANMKGRDNLILREDQREYEKAKKAEKYRKELDLLDPDYLPSLITGQRVHKGGVKVGFGRQNPNAVRKTAK